VLEVSISIALVSRKEERAQISVKKWNMKNKKKEEERIQHPQ